MPIAVRSYVIFSPEESISGLTVIVSALYTDQDRFEVAFSSMSGGCTEKSNMTGISVELSVGTITLTVSILEPPVLVAVSV